MRKHQIISLCVLILVSACDDRPTGPTVQEVSGEYAALILRLHQNAESVDLLDAGAELMIALAVDGTTTGHVFLPGAGEGGGDINASLNGTWTLKEETVDFDFPGSDNIVEQRTFTLTGNLLVNYEGDLDIVLVREL